MSPKSRKCGPKAFEKLTRKTYSKSDEKRVQNTSKNELKKIIPRRFFEVWRQRCSQGGPKGSPRHLLGSNLREKGAKMETKCDEKVLFFEVQLKAKCYRILFLRLARLGGKTYGGCLPDASQGLPEASQMLPSQFPASPRGVEDGLHPGAETKSTSDIFRDLKNRTQKVVPKVPKWRPQTHKVF